MAKRIEGSPPSSVPATPLRPFYRRLFFLFLCSSLPFLVNSQGPAVGVADEERRVLLQMKAEWQSPPSLSSWNSSSSPCGGGWNGVECGPDGSVTAITLVDQGIEGGVPNATCQLRNLSSLNLFNNSVGGGFPTGLYGCSNLLSLNLSQNLFVGAIPADVDRLSKLTVLDLSANNFSGDIPAAIARISGLRQLRLDNNLFDGTFPKELGNLAALENLALANNPFKPTGLPAEFGDLKRLKYLWVAQAYLVGEIPESLGNLTDLEHLDLSSNSLTGTIPGRLWQLEKLQFVYLYHNKLSGRIAAAGTITASGLREVDLSMNQLSGPIPEEFAKQPNLRLLFLYRNHLSGVVPDGIGSIPALADIRLFDNNLAGVLPAELGKHSKLSILEVGGNDLSGDLPEELCAGDALVTLVISNNNFTGKLPSSLGQCVTLYKLFVDGNNLSGEVPARIWSLPNLEMVIMNGNMLSGELPESLPPYLSRLEIGDNMFSGELTSSSPSLQVFKASHNLFSGEIPTNLTGWGRLQVLLLDRNQISGEIPAGIASLQSLSDLNVSDNHLTGNIPGAIGSLPVLTTLDLSNNRLSGEIPKELGALRLNFLDLSSNLLTGQIPAPLQNQAYGRSFLSNTGLCSSSPLLNLPPCGATKSGGSNGLSKGMLTLILVLGILFFLITLTLGFFVVRDLRHRKYGGDDLSSWKLTSFQVMDFSEARIIRGLTADRLIGSGSSGQVYRVPLGNRAGDVVAVKKIWNSKKLDSKLERDFEAEVRILGSIRHTNIVKLLCCISNTDSKLLVYEHMENGSLDHWLHGESASMAVEYWPSSAGQQGILDWPARLSVAVGAARGLCYMHHDCSPPIVHRDVKSGNILLDKEFKPKVADFGLARMMGTPGEPDTISAVAGSIGYMAPECAYSKVNEKVDVYSFGVVLLELTTGRRASDGGEHGSLADWAWRQFQEGNSVADVLDAKIRDPLYSEEMSAVLKLGLICTGTLPSTRPTMKEVLQVLLRYAHTDGEGDKLGPEYDEVPLLQDARKKNSRRKRPSVANDGEDEESSLACNV